MNRNDKLQQRKEDSKPAATKPVKQEHIDEILDEALEETFPASDPIELTPARNG